MIGVVSHDPGGAEVISSYVRQNGLTCGYALGGAANRIFSGKLGAIEQTSLENLVSSCEWLLCGTSFSSDLEWRAIGLARDAGKLSVAVLDHWINYRQRFQRHGVWHFPDEIWVGDTLAESLARKELPDTKVVLVPNPYFEDIRQQLAALDPLIADNGGGVRALYVSEPVREGGKIQYNDALYWGYSEEDALRYFLSNVGCLGNPIDQIAVRPHPRECAEKYLWAEDEFDLPIVTQSGRTLLEQIVESNVVAGCATMAMVVGLMANKRVVSCIPPGGRTIPLPHPEIETMWSLIKATDDQQPEHK